MCIVVCICSYATDICQATDVYSWYELLIDLLVPFSSRPLRLHNPYKSLTEITTRNNFTEHYLLDVPEIFLVA